MIRRILLYAALVGAIAVAACSAYSSPQRVHGVAWDDTAWAGLVLPDSCAVVRVTTEGELTVFPVPKGTVVLLPIPPLPD